MDMQASLISSYLSMPGVAVVSGTPKLRYG
jgi:hypothetical protein